MKAYVNYYGSGKDARAELHWEDIRDDEIAVQYRDTPEHWTMGREEAKSRCSELNRSHVHAKNQFDHHCQFDVEEMGNGQCAIVCSDHPDFSRSVWIERSSAAHA